MRVAAFSGTFVFYTTSEILCEKSEISRSGDHFEKKSAIKWRGCFAVHEPICSCHNILKRLALKQQEM